MKTFFHSEPARVACLAILFSATFPLASGAEPAVFEGPEAAVSALVAALEARDRDALIEVFGPENEDVALTGDPEEDRAIWTEFMDDYRTLNRM